MIHKHLLPQYVHTHRKLTGYTQGETAFLLRCEGRSLIAAYESNESLPNLEHALALAAIFGVSVEELFAGINERVAAQVAERAKELIRLLELQPHIWEIRQKIWRLHRLVERIEGEQPADR